MNGKELKQKRITMGMSVRDVATKIGVTARAIYKIENRSNLKMDTINRYLAGLGVGRVVSDTSWNGKLEPKVAQWSALVLEYVRRVREDGTGLTREQASAKTGVSVDEIIAMEEGRIVNWNTFAYYMYRLGIFLEVKKTVPVDM
jgi:transcriptional regulator with XRE-family HTH domain